MHIANIRALSGGILLLMSVFVLASADQPPSIASELSDSQRISVQTHGSGTELY